MHDFADLTSSFDKTNPPYKSWTQVRSQIQKALPSMLDSDWGGSHEKTPDQWLRAVNAVVAARDNPDEFLIWVVDAGMPDAQGYAVYPQAGRHIAINSYTFAISKTGSSTKAVMAKSGMPSALSTPLSQCHSPIPKH